MGYDKPENKAQMTPQEQVDAIQEKAKEYVDTQYERYNELMIELKDYEIVMCEPHELSEPLLSKLKEISS